MIFDDIEKLVDLVARSSVAEVSVRWDGKRITVRKPRQCDHAHEALEQASHMAVEPEPALPEEAPAPAVSEVHWIAAPLVGIFRHAEPPVGPGVRVEQGQVVGAIEAIKLMNEVRADVSGIVREVAVEAGMPVEYGQHLISVAAEEP